METSNDYLFSANNNVKLKFLRHKTKKISEDLILEETFPFAKFCEITTTTQPAIEAKESETKLQIVTKQPEHRKYLTSERIVAIKKEVDDAIRQRKIFYLCGHFRSVKRALINRGWIEKTQVKSQQKCPSNVQTNDITQLDSSRNENDALFQNLPTQQAGETLDQHLKKCEIAIKARLLQSHSANLYWNIRKESLVWLNAIPRDALINRFPKVRFTSKEGLCTILQQMHWYTEPGVAVINFPRCYNLSYPDQLVSFLDDFRLTACMSLLKNFLSILTTEGEIAVRSIAGSVSMSVVYFAIDRCLEYVQTAEHKDLDIDFRKVWDHEWENFFACFDVFVYQKKRFLHKVGDEGIEELKEKITHTLKKMVQYWPQYNLDGMRNVWIVKPGNRCRGQGIMLMDKYQSILGLVLNCNPKKHRYVVQKYVERPFIIYETKFDIRQWFLLTSAQPLILWMYTECYLRFSSQLFCLNDFHESIHLTNNAVQKKYKKQSSQQRNKELPDENMWDCYTFKAYLRKIGQYEKWDNFIYPSMKEAIVGAMLASQDNMDRKGNYFELYGADFILGQDLVPWLLEINSSPDMSGSTSVTARMCPQCLEDVVKVVIDRKEDPTADTGLFELVYKQQCPRPPTYLGLQLTVRGKRMSRHKLIKNIKSSEHINTVNDQPFEKSIIATIEDYQGPIIDDFIEELKRESKCILKSGDSDKISAGRRKRRSNSVRNNRTVQQFQPTINTITMKSKSFIQNPFSFSNTRTNGIKKPLPSKHLGTSTLKSNFIDETLTDNKKSLKINRYMESKTSCNQNATTKLLLSKKDLEVTTKPDEDTMKNNSKGTCPRLVRSMYDNSNLSKSILHSFLTVGLQLNNNNNNNNYETNTKSIINPLRVNGTAARPNSKAKA